MATEAKIPYLFFQKLLWGGVRWGGVGWGASAKLEMKAPQTTKCGHSKPTRNEHSLEGWFKAILANETTWPPHAINQELQ